MSEYLTEQEQVELLKNWVKQYSMVILLGVAISMLGIYGWRFWQHRQYKILSHASSVYDEMLTKRVQNDAAATEIQASKLFEHYDKTAYGQFAAFMTARDAVISKDFAKAETELTWVIDHSKIDSMRQIARLRLARIYLTQNNPKASLALLDTIEDQSFNGLISEVKGDAYLALHDTDNAREAYQRALNELPQAESIRPLLQMKYDNLATPS